MKNDQNARRQARLQLMNIQSMLQEFDNALAKVNNGNESPEVDAAIQRIQEDPLSVELREAWYVWGCKPNDEPPIEYRILLCAGGPAVRIVGDLDDDGIPCAAHLEFQDWFTPWKEYRLNVTQEQQVLRYVKCIYEGDL